MAILEYLMVYTEAGLPIYSKCYGSFCKTAFKNPELLSGFLSAIQTLPMTISTDLTLESIKMGPTEMKFSRTVPTGHSVVIGVGEDAPDVADKVFEAVADILTTDQFRNVDWSVISSDIMDAFEEELLENSLVEALKEHGGFEDQCPLGDKCPIHTTAIQYKTRRGKVWSMIKGKYEALRRKMSGGS
jgi:hypothetical protein